MNTIKLLAIYIFNIIDKFIHQKRILNNIKKNIKGINTYIDVGAHKGTYTDLILKNFKVKKVFMFEPQKNICKYIKKKYSKNRKIKIYMNAASDQTKKKKIYINKHDITSSLTKLNEKNLYLYFKSKLFGANTSQMVKDTYYIKTIKLADFIKKNKLKKIDLLKIDTEGHEQEVLKGMGKKIGITKMILIEIHNDDIYLKYSSDKIHNHLIKNQFYLKKIIKFPFTTWEDRIYINKN